jgi:positive regulator of sigma E activity
MRRQELLILTLLQLAIVAAVGIHEAQLLSAAMFDTVVGLILIMVAGATAYALSNSIYSH